MKGLHAPGWHWAAVGKHPVARDYIRLGRSSPVTSGFADWVAGGYRALEIPDKKAIPLPCSFRFWARGVGPGALACGVVRDSSDAVGRPFPLLIMGSGTLSGWEKRWEALPLACESAWGQMESLANRNVRDLKLLEEDLARIRPPQPEWDRYAEIGTAAPDDRGGKGVEMDLIVDGIGTRARAAAAEAAGIVPLDQVPGGDFFPVIQAWHSGLKAQSTEPPSALFVGGNAQRTWMAYFRRPLEAGDFPRIWGPPAEAA